MTTAGAWDPDRPLLGALIAEMYARDNISIAVSDHGVAFTNTNDVGRPVRDSPDPFLLVDGAHQPVSFAALVGEQVDGDDLFVATLSGRATQYWALVPVHLAPPDVNRPHSRTRELTITAFWEKQQVIIHRHLFINGVPASAQTAAAYQALVDLNTPHNPSSRAAAF